MNTDILVLDVGLGNVGSICNMLKHIGVASYRSKSKQDILKASKIILPGVGAFDAGMKSLEDADVINSLVAASKNHETKILGICLGMHLLFDKSEEGESKGLGLIPGYIKRFTPENTNLKVPHMGWNKVIASNHSKLLKSDQSELRYYFVHSYHAVCNEEINAVGFTDYDLKFASVAERENIMGVQFHPEKSHRFGMDLLKNFAELK